MMLHRRLAAKFCSGGGHFRRFFALFVFAFFWMTASLRVLAGVLTVSGTVVGATPKILGYNAGHFYPGSNTRDWWHYSGVSGARVFISPSYIEPSDALPPWGDGVTDQTSFLSRKALVRSDPNNTNYFNWASVTNRFATSGQIGNNILQPDFACAELRKLGVEILVVATGSASKFPGTTSWADKWEIWHYYYEQAFYLGRRFDVQRYQMYNEPNAVTGFTEADWFARLQLASDAIQCGIADVNSMYGKALTPIVAAPVSAGNATNHYSDWGAPVVTNRHVNFLGQSNANFSLLQGYDYHHYSSTPAAFGSELVALQNQLALDMAPEPAFPTTISEFNDYTGATFNTLTSTLDTPANYSALGSIGVNLIKYLESEIYCFKFSQTFSTYIAKNGMHFVDNDTVPYNIGGITKAGEVWRLINKGFAPGRERLNVQADAGASGLDVQASYDPLSHRYYLLSVNNTSSGVPLTANLSAWNIPTNHQALVEEVSENCYGAGAIWTNVGSALSVSGTQGSNSAWLVTIPSQPQFPLQTVIATDDAQVTDGANKNVNFGAASSLLVKNNSTNASMRSAGFLKFSLAGIDPANIQMAVLTVNASSVNGASVVQAHVYGITNNNWSQSAITWNNAPALKQNVGPGTGYTNNFISGQGDSAQLVGQLVAGAVQAKRAMDVTDFLKSCAGGAASFLLAREVRFLGDSQDGDGISIVSIEGDPSKSPRLEIVMNAPLARPYITGITKNTNGSLSLSFSGTASQTYVVQGATNVFFPSWINLSTNIAGTNGVWSFTDLGGTNFPMRYYRALLP